MVPTLPVRMVGAAAAAVGWEGLITPREEQEAMLLQLVHREAAMDRNLEEGVTTAPAAQECLEEEDIIIMVLRVICPQEEEDLEEEVEGTTMEQEGLVEQMVISPILVSAPITGRIGQSGLLMPADISTAATAA